MRKLPARLDGANAKPLCDKVAPYVEGPSSAVSLPGALLKLEMSAFSANTVSGSCQKLFAVVSETASFNNKVSVLPSTCRPDSSAPPGALPCPKVAAKDHDWRKTRKRGTMIALCRNPSARD